jgi:hypothetical protein
MAYIQYILQYCRKGKNRVYQPHNNNIHQLYNNEPSGHRENEKQKVRFEVCALVGFYRAFIGS